MKRPLKNALLVCAAALALGACETDTSAGKPPPALVFDHLQYYPVQVGTVDVINSYGQSKNPADYSMRFAAPPDETLANYLRARFKPQGGQGGLVFDIQEASVFVFHAPSDIGMIKWMDMGGYDEYSMTVKLRMRAENVPGFYAETKDFTARRRVKISQHASIADRERDQFQAIDLMLKDIDAAVFRALREEFHLIP